MASRAFRRYAGSVVAQISCSQAEKRRIKEDIIDMLEERSMRDYEEDPVVLMGKASEVAADFSENLMDPETALQPLEYRSDIEILGLPLYHIVPSYKVRQGAMTYSPVRVAKGIVAVGPVAIGAVAFGGFSAGIISLGGLSLGGLTAIGGIAVAYDMALGGLAIASNLACGGTAIAREVAMGGLTQARLMLYTQEFRQPANLDEGAYMAFKAIHRADFNRVFQETYENFGLIKEAVVRWFAA